MKKYDKKLLFNTFMKLNKIVDPNFDFEYVTQEILSLEEKVTGFLSDKASDEKKLKQLLDFIYKIEKFYCDDNNHFNSENLNLEFMFKYKTGMPITLAAILLYLADTFELNIYPVMFPTQFLLRVDLNKKTLFFDSWDGKFYSKQELSLLLKGYLGYGTVLKPEYISIVSEEYMLKRIEQIYKNTLVREGHSIEALNLIEAILIKQPKDPYEIRDRGLILASLDCNKAAALDLDYFIAKCPNDPSVQLLEAHILELNSSIQLMH